MKTSVIYCGDNLNLLANRESFPDESVDLIYLDPPFFSNRNYEVIWKDEAEIKSFEDRWQGGIEVYIAWMRERVIEMHRILKKTGSIYLHCDWHASHYLKVMLDTLWGYKNFRNNIVWCYKTRQFSKRYWNRKHGDILFYTKGDKYIFNWLSVAKPYSKSTIKKYRLEDAKGKYRLVGRGIKDSPIKSAKDVNPDWEKTHPELVKRNYLGKGYPPEDYLLIDIINQRSKERLGYPTQKPEKLLVQIISASSNKNDIVLDPFCGCGTTLIVAEKLKRQWIGIDISPTACGVMNQRLNKIGVKNAELIGMPQTTEDLKNLKPFEFQNWVMREGFVGGTVSHKKTGDMGIDGKTYLQHEPIQVKQSKSIGRNVVDNFETAIERNGKKKGYIVAFSFTKDAYEEAARCKREKQLEIELITVDDLLKKIEDRKRQGKGT